MNKAMPMREIANIGKEFIRRISKITETYSTVYDENDNTFINVVKQRRMSRLQILQLLLYHFLGLDSNGVIRFVSERQLADTLQCSLKTIRINNEIFKEFNLVSYTRYDDGLLSVMLTNYKSYSLKKDEGGTGYIRMTPETFFKLTKENEINKLRTELRKLLQADVLDIKPHQEVATFTYKQIQEFLPDYIRGKRAIQRIVEESLGLFETTVDANKVSFRLRPEFNGKQIYQTKKTLYNQAYHTLLNSRNLKSEKLVDDLVQMSFQYGNNIVIESLDHILEFCRLREIVVKSDELGRLIRHHIETSRKNVA